jgi:glucuronosyltransferase
MGSALKGSMLPEKYRIAFTSAFSKLKQKVLWKWEADTMPDLPKNIKIRKWFPQQGKIKLVASFFC